MSRMVGTVSRGVRAPIIRNGDNLVEIEGVWTQEADAKLVAKWSLETYSISYELNGGTVDGTVDSYTYETESFVLPILHSRLPKSYSCRL